MQQLRATEISLKKVFFRTRPLQKFVSNETDEIFMKIVYLGGVEHVQKFSSKSERVKSRDPSRDRTKENRHSTLSVKSYEIV